MSSTVNDHGATLTMKGDQAFSIDIPDWTTGYSITLAHLLYNIQCRRDCVSLEAEAYNPSSLSLSASLRLPGGPFQRASRASNCEGTDPGKQGGGHGRRQGISVDNDTGINYESRKPNGLRRLGLTKRPFGTSGKVKVARNPNGVTLFRQVGPNRQQGPG